MKTTTSSSLATLLLLGALSSGAMALDLQAIAPAQGGFTLQKSPVLYYYISQATTLPIRFTLSAEGTAHPAIQVLLNSPAHAGLWAIRLEEYGIVLEEGVPYRWSVTVRQDQDSKEDDIVAGSLIKRIDPRSMDYRGPGCDQDRVLLASRNTVWLDVSACADELKEANRDEHVHHDIGGASRLQGRK